jgi:chemotaxis protein methyltransferase CheR
MDLTLGAAELERFRAFVEEWLGFHYDHSRLDSLADVLRERLCASAHSNAVDYVNALCAFRSEGELRALIDRLTVTETYFFRNPDHFRVLAELALPGRIRVQESRRKLRILSAGCASGEEAYSLAILVRDQFPQLQSWDVRILGIDVNEGMIEKAKAGRYTAWSLRETPAETRDRHFRPHGREFVLDDSIRNSVAFQRVNLVDDHAELWGEASFDVILCRNVIMYLAPLVSKRIIDRMSTALAPGGYLFLGHAETLRGISTEFHLRHTHSTFYYERREGVHVEPTAGRPASASEPFPVTDTLVPASALSTTWFDVIGRSFDRVAMLSRAPAGSPSASGTTPSSTRADVTLPSPAWNRSKAAELVRDERFMEALELVSGLPGDYATDPEARLLRAILLTNAGLREEAERVCAELLASDELQAGAHYLMALCRDQAGDRSSATDHDQEALYLDPTFAMARLHLGLMAKRSGDRDGARRELQHAVALLAGEDSSRLLLFGGGFSREALVRFCQLELQGCGVAA